MALIALCLWVVAAWGLMVTLTARRSWPAVYGLATVGVPLVVWLGWTMGWLWALVGAAVMAVVLRWPLRRLFQFLRGLTGRKVPR